MNFIIRREQISQIYVADPYYRHQSFLSLDDFECKANREYIEYFMIANKYKETVLLPYPM